MSGHNPPFIVIALCDNDYGQQLEQTAKAIEEAFRGSEFFVSDLRMKGIVIDLMVAFTNLRYAAYGSSTDNTLTRAYLGDALEVRFEQHAPTDDHDGGSVAIDRNRNYVWRY